MKRFSLKIIALVLVSIMVVTVCPVAARATGKPGSEYGYDINWKYWSQAGTEFTSSSAGARANMASSGCFIVSSAKMLMESGCATSSFTPDVWLEYLISKNLVSSSIAVNSRNVTSNYTNGLLTYAGSVALSGTDDAKAAKIQEKLNQGYYVMLYWPKTTSYTQHFTYVLRDDSLAAGYPIISRTQSDTYNSIHYPWSKNRIVESFSAWDKSSRVTEMLYYSMNCSYYVANGNHDYITVQDENGCWCGKCNSCGNKYYWSEVMTDEEHSTGMFKVLNQYIRVQPYQAAALANYCAETVKIVGYVKNAYGNKWYVLSDGNYIHSPNVSYIGPITSGSVPDVPTGLAAAHSGTSNIQITWNAVSGATQYEAQYIRSGISWTALAASPTTATSILAKGFSWNYDYVDFRVRAVNAEGASEWATIRLYKANPSAPAAPTVTVSGSSVTVSWTDVENENSYDVYLVQSPWAWEDIKYSKTGLTANTTSFTFPDVAAGNYKAFVISRPNNDSVQSGWTAVTVISPPQNTKVTTNKSLYSLGETVTITPSATGATYYAVSVWDGGDYGVGKQVYYNGHFTGSVSFTPETAGTYGILCNAFNDGGRVSAKTTFDVVAVELTGWMSSEGTIHLSWTNPGWDGYWDIFRNSEASFGAAQKVARLNGNASSWVDNTTQPSSRYFYVVQPVTISGSGLAKSGAVEFITPDPAPPVIDSVAADKTAVTAGTSVTWTASASGGSGTLQYCFYVFKNGSVIERGSYGTAKTYSYKPTAAGTYTVRVYVKDPSGNSVSLDNAAAVTVSAAPPTITGVTANKTAVAAGPPITWTASASGGTGTLQYCFYVFKDGKIAQRGNYGVANTYTYAPGAGGVYTVRVYVKDSKGLTATLDNAAAVTVSAAPPAITGVTASRTTANVGDSVTWTASASGGTGTLQYCFYVFKDGKIAQRGSYGTAKTYTYTPAAAGTYTVRVYVKDAYGTVVTLDHAGMVRVTAPAVPISITGVTPSRTAVTKGDSITWTASATGGTGTLQYCFYVFKNGKIAERGSYGTAKSYTYVPSTAGTYTVRVYVKDASGTVVTLDNAGAVTVS